MRSRTRTVPRFAILLGVLTAAAGALAMPAVAGAQSPAQDSVTGSVTTFGNVAGFEIATYEISATSGPSGESPNGQVVATSNGPFFSGPVQCLFVQGNVALMTVQTATFGLLALRLTDNAGLGAADLVEVTFASAATPTHCSVAEGSYLRRDRVTAGDIVVVDAQPLPSSREQCKDGGWHNFGGTFKNQGQCVAFVERGPKPKP